MIFRSPSPFGLASALFPLAALFLAFQGDATTPLEARGGFETKLVTEERHTEPLEKPPGFILKRVKYPAPLGEMMAYVSPDPGRSFFDDESEEVEQRPAMIWVTGGFPPGGIGSMAWESRPATNDQSAKCYGKADMVMMYPTFRGSFGNPGVQEGFFGEVDDLLAAAEALAEVEYVDPERIYLGGHSTGGTLALLAAASAPERFRAVFAFGPVTSPLEYGSEQLFDAENPEEARLRSPIEFLDALATPTYVIEGSRGNADSARAMAAATENENLHVRVVPGANHFNVLAASNALIAERIAELPADGELELSLEDLTAAVGGVRAMAREADDLESLAEARREEVVITEPQTLVFFVWDWEEAPVERAAEEAERMGLVQRGVDDWENDNGDTYYEVQIELSVVPADLDQLFAASKRISDLCDAQNVRYDGWIVSGNY